MTRPIAHHPDPELDLVFERSVDVPRELVWQAWTDPEHVKQWFTPAPWSTVECEIDLRPGGIFRTVMRSPEGDEHTNLGCFLEVIEGERLTWTEALEPGFRPSRTGSHIETCGTSTLTAVPRSTVSPWAGSTEITMPSSTSSLKLSTSVGTSPSASRASNAACWVQCQPCAPAKC